jgi:hypothetical protein
VDNLSSLPWDGPLTLGLLHHSHLPSPSLPVPPLTEIWPENRGHGNRTPSGFPHYQSIPAYPNAPAGFIDHPTLDTTPSTLPFPSSSPKPAQTANPRSPSVPTAAAYKRPPFLAEKTHTIPSYLPDILLSLLALAIELAGAGRAPRAPRILDDSDRSPTCRRSRAAEKDPLRRCDTPPLPTTAAGEPLDPRLLPGSLSLCPVGLGKMPDNNFVIKS